MTTSPDNSSSDHGYPRDAHAHCHMINLTRTVKNITRHQGTVLIYTRAYSTRAVRTLTTRDILPYRLDSVVV